MSEKTSHPPPPGLELLFTSAIPENPTAFAALILPIHWSVIRANNRLITDTASGSTSEQLPENWSTWIDEDSSLLLLYKNLNTGEKIEVKVVEVVKNEHIAVSRLNGDAIMVKLREFVDVDGVGERSFGKTYKVDKLVELENKVQEMFSEGEKKVVKEDENRKKKSCYDTNMTDEQLERLEQERKKKKLEEEEKLRNPLFVPPRHNPFGGIGPTFGGGIGRSDLDPFGGIGGGGMVADPRGFRGGFLPGGVRPPRFDPFGPLGGGGMGGGGAGFPRGPMMPFGGPDNDLERPPRGGGYDDMFM